MSPIPLATCTFLPREDEDSVLGILRQNLNKGPANVPGASSNSDGTHLGFDDEKIVNLIVRNKDAVVDVWLIFGRQDYSYMVS